MHNCKDLLCETPHYEEPTDSGYSTKTIPIECSECPGRYTEIGLDAMVEHIKKKHKTYSDLEANEYAMRWLDSAYDNLEQGERDYYEDRKNEDKND